MAQEYFKLKVITPLDVLVDQDIQNLIVTTTVGSMGVRAGHAPMIVALVPGMIFYQADDLDFSLELDGGLMDIQDKSVLILAEMID